MEEYGRGGQATDDNIIRHMRFKCRIPKVTDRHSESYILPLHVNDGYANMPERHVICPLPFLFAVLLVMPVQSVLETLFPHLIKITKLELAAKTSTRVHCKHQMPPLPCHSSSSMS